MTSAWKDRGDDISFPGQSFEQLNKYKKAKSLAKPKKVEAPVLSEEDVEGMKRRYEEMDIVPIFHNRSVSGTKVST